MRKKALPIVVSAVLLSFGSTEAPLAAQGLADVARQEQVRRKAIKKPSKVLTNKDLAAVPQVTVPPAAPSDPGGTAPAAGGGTDADKTTPAAGEAGNDQASWSGRMKGLQTQLERNQAFAVALQSQINALTTQYVNQADPVQQAKVATDRQKAIAELSRLTKQVEDDKKAIADLQETARRAGIPAGWLR